MGLAKRIIPCLDVAAGRVVKGVNFVNLRDAGDPVEVARRYDEQGADELAFLDIRASIETRGLLYDMIEAVADQVFIPLTVGGGVNSVDDIRALLNAGADKVSINTAGVRNPGFRLGGGRALRRAVHRRGDRREAVGAGIVGGLHARRAHADRHRRDRLGARGRRARRRRNPAHQHGPRRRAHGLRPRADARGRRRGRRPGHRVRRRRDRSRIWSTGSSTGGADAVLAASIFHYGEFTIAQAKAAMAAAGIECGMKAPGATTDSETGEWLDAVKWQADGLVPAIAQDAATGKVLTLAWMNREALRRRRRTTKRTTGRARARALWRKGEQSGHVQRVREIRLDCDNDAILVVVEQVGGIACHTGRERASSSGSKTGAGTAVEPVRKDPEAIYGAR